MENALQKSYEIANIKDIHFSSSDVVNGKKLCSICKKLKLLSEFANNILCSFGKDYRCKACQREMNRIYYAKFVGKSLDQVRKPIKIVDGKKLCAHCKQWKLISSFGKSEKSKCGLRFSCRKCEYTWHRVKSNLIKMEFVIVYGGCCQCCGEKELSLLTVEHIRGKGHILMHESSTMTLLFKLKEQGWPEGYTVLCYNCNLSTKNGRLCVHSNEYKIYDKKFRLLLANDSRRAKYYKLENELKTMNGRR